MKVDHAPGDSVNDWKVSIIGWRSQVHGIQCLIHIGDDDIQIFYVIKELEELIDEEASTTRLEESSMLVEARLQEVSARGADGPSVAMSGKERLAKQQTALCDKGSPGVNSKCLPTNAEKG